MKDIEVLSGDAGEPIAKVCHHDSELSFFRLLQEDRLHRLNLSLDKDTNAFTVKPRLWCKIIVLNLHIAVVCLIHLHVHTSENARSC